MESNNKYNKIQITYYIIYRKLYYNECTPFYIVVPPVTLPPTGSNLVKLPAMGLLSVENFSETIRLYTDYCMPKIGYFWTFEDFT